MSDTPPPEPASSRPTDTSTPDPQRVQALIEAWVGADTAADPMDAMAMDGWLVASLLHARPAPPAAWLPPLLGGGSGPARAAAARAPAELVALLHARRAELERAIAARRWFDPWVWPGDDDAAEPSAVVLPWCLGFALGAEALADPRVVDDPALHEPLALVWRHLGERIDVAGDDDEAFVALCDEIEPPRELGEAVEELVRATLLLADGVRPRRDGGPQRTPRPPRPAVSARSARARSSSR